MSFKKIILDLCHNNYDGGELSLIVDVILKHNKRAKITVAMRELPARRWYSSVSTMLKSLSKEQCLRLDIVLVRGDRGYIRDSDDKTLELDIITLCKANNTVFKNVAASNWWLTIARRVQISETIIR